MNSSRIAPKGKKIPLWSSFEEKRVFGISPFFARLVWKIAAGPQSAGLKFRCNRLQPRLTFSDDFGGAWQLSNSASCSVFRGFICKVRREICRTRARLCVGNGAKHVCVRYRDQRVRVKVRASVPTQMKLRNETSVSVSGAQLHPPVLKQTL